ncbi:MAG: hypothetical protein AABY87_04655 [bacterium]
MLSISFEINGKKVDPDNIADELEKAILKKIEETIVERVGAVRCSEHDAAPIIVAHGQKIENLTFKVSGCCARLIGDVKAMLS